MHEQMRNLGSELETKSKTQIEMLEIRHNNRDKEKNAFVKLLSTPDTAEGKISKTWRQVSRNYPEWKRVEGKSEPSTQEHLND